MSDDEFADMPPLTPQQRALCRAALAAIEARKHETTEAWAQRLAIHAISQEYPLSTRPTQPYVFIGIAPEDGDTCLVWAKTPLTAMALGRERMGYGHDQEPYSDDDFRVVLASPEAVWTFCSDSPTLAVQDVLAERERQRQRWGDAHDDEHTFGALRIAAAELAVDGTDAHVEHPDGPDMWGLVQRYGHGGTQPNPRRALVISVALLLAEIERLDRTAQAASTKQPAPETPEQTIVRLTKERDAWKERAAKHGCDVVNGDPDCG